MRNYTFEMGVSGHRLTPYVKRIMWLNVSIWFLMWITGSLWVHEWFSFQPYKILIRPWGAVTYMFVHGGFWHVFVNMLLLFFLGPPLERKWGSQAFLQYFLACGLGGAVLSYAFVANSIIGASAGIYGVMLAFALIWPNLPIYLWGIFPLKAKWLVTLMFVMTFSSAVGQTGDGVAHFAHLGGFVSGFIFLPGNRSFVHRMTKLWKDLKNSSAKRSHKNSNLKLVREKESELNSKKESAISVKVDMILDKIAKDGMSSLTEREKKLLSQAAKKRQSN